jgi:ATP-binding cassette subfamily F protein 3
VVQSQEQRKAEAQLRQQVAQKIKPLKKTLDQAEKRIATLNLEKTDIENKFTTSIPPQEIAELGQRLKVINDELETLEEQWLNLTTEIDSIENSI